MNSLVSSVKELERVRPRSTVTLFSPNCLFHPTVGMVTFITTSSVESRLSRTLVSSLCVRRCYEVGSKKSSLPGEFEQVSFPAGVTLIDRASCSHQR